MIKNKRENKDIFSLRSSRAADLEIDFNKLLAGSLHLCYTIFYHTSNALKGIFFENPFVFNLCLYLSINIGHSLFCLIRSKLLHG